MRKHRKIKPTYGARSKLARVKKRDRLHRFADWLNDWHLTRILSALGSFALILTLMMLWVDFSDRYQNRTTQAWQLLTAQAPGNSGKREALEYLNKAIPLIKVQASLQGIDLGEERHGGRVNLVGAQLNDVITWESNFQGAYLAYSSLSNANFAQSNLTETNFFEADLSHASLNSANVKRAYFIGAILKGANLAESNFTDAIFMGANLKDAHLVKADLTNANLYKVSGLTQSQLDDACYRDKKPQNLPDGLTHLTMQRCPDD